jgi:hypothetical protein
MLFKIAGASKATGEEVEATIEARDQRAAEKWAADSGILWTSITTSGGRGVPPPLPAHGSAQPYAAEKDGVIWIIGIVAVLLDLVLGGRGLLSFDAAGLGALTGMLLGAFVLVFLLGLIGSKIGGKKPLRARIGFFIGAAMAVSIVAVGEHRIGRQRAEDLASSEQIINQIRSSLPGSTQPTHSSGMAGSLTATDISGSEAADLKVLLTEVQKFQAEANAKGVEFQNRTAAILGDGILQPSKLDTKEKIVAAKSKLAQLGALIDARDADMDAMYDGMLDRFNALPIGQDMKRGAIQGYQANVEKGKSALHEITDTERQFVAASNELVDFLQSRLGNFEVKGSKILFADGADVTTYNEKSGKIQELVAKEQSLIQRQQETARQSMDSMERYVTKK